jgi:Cu/Ag efflux protein CusF
MVMKKIGVIVLAIFFLGMMSCASTPSPAIQTGEGEGIVTGYDPGSKYIVVQHGEIPGMMGPMTMEFTVDDVRLLEGLKKGDKIRMTIEARPPADWVITRVTRLAD